MQQTMDDSKRIVAGQREAAEHTSRTFHDIAKTVTNIVENTNRIVLQLEEVMLLK